MAGVTLYLRPLFQKVQAEPPKGAENGSNASRARLQPPLSTCEAHPHGGVRLFNQNPTDLSQLTLKPCVVQI